ncbi:MAG: putative ABC transporter permease [Clostridia bacterium]|nr:putative ABC transporter permease [Clostridia bacterium]
MASKRKPEESVLNYIISFFIYSVVLWVYKVIFSWAVNPSGLETGVLYGPYMPFYGLCIMFVMLIFNLIKKYGKEKDINPTPILLIVMSVVLLGGLEFLGSLAYESIFKVAPWDYSKMVYNINGRICCENTIFLSVFELICVYIAQPFLNKILDKVWLSGRIIISMAIVAVLITDIICTFMK